MSGNSMHSSALDIIAQRHVEGREPFFVGLGHDLNAPVAAAPSAPPLSDGEAAAILFQMLINAGLARLGRFFGELHHGR